MYFCSDHADDIEITKKKNIFLSLGMCLCICTCEFVCVYGCPIIRCSKNNITGKKKHPCFYFPPFSYVISSFSSRSSTSSSSSSSSVFFFRQHFLSSFLLQMSKWKKSVMSGEQCIRIILFCKMDHDTLYFS